MAYTTQYIGSRYVPIFADPAEWNSARTYEPLTIVLHEGNSYTSRQFVPAGIEITNESYWVLSANYNAQVEAYRKDVKSLEGRVTANTNAIETETTNRTAAVNAEKTRAENAEQTLNKKLYYVTPEEYGAAGDGVTNDTNALIKALDSGKSVYLQNKYLVDTIDFSKYDNTFMFSDKPTTTYVKDNEKALIVFTENGGFNNKFVSNKNSYYFENINFKNGSIKAFWNTTFNNCSFNASNGVEVHGGHINLCTFNKCIMGISYCDDSIISETSFNSCTTAIHNPQSSIVANCVIQWCTTGIDISGTGGLLNTLIQSNRFDRNDVAIHNELHNLGLSINNNMFRRSVNYHITGTMSYNLCNNFFIQNNSEDDGSGTSVPASPLKLSRQQGTHVFSNNTFFGTPTNVFNDSSWSEDGTLSAYGNVFEGYKIGDITFKGTASVNESSHTINIDVGNYNGYGVYNPVCKIKSYKNNFLFVSTNIYINPVGHTVYVPVPTDLTGTVTYELMFKFPFDYQLNNMPIKWQP